MSKSEGGRALDLIRRFESLSAEMSSLSPNSTTRPSPMTQSKTDTSTHYKNNHKASGDANVEKLEPPGAAHLQAAEFVQSSFSAVKAYSGPSPNLRLLRKATFSEDENAEVSYNSSLRRGSTWSNADASISTKPYNGTRSGLGSTGAQSYDAIKNNDFSEAKAVDTVDKLKGHVNAPSPKPILRTTTPNSIKHVAGPGLSRANSCSSINGKDLLSILDKRAEIDTSANNTDSSWLELALQYVDEARKHKRANNLESAYVEFMMACNIFSKRLHSPHNSISIVNNPDYIRLRNDISNLVVDELEELQGILGSQSHRRSSNTPKLLSRAQSLVRSNKSSTISLQQLAEGMESTDEFIISASVSPTKPHPLSRRQNNIDEAEVHSLQRISATGSNTGDDDTLQGITIVNRNRQSNRNAVVIGEDMGTFDDFEYFAGQNMEVLSTSNSAKDLSVLKHKDHAETDTREVISTRQQHRVESFNPPLSKPRVSHSTKFNEDGRSAIYTNDNDAYSYDAHLYKQDAKDPLSRNKYTQRSTALYRQNNQQKENGDASNVRVRRWSPPPEEYKYDLPPVPPTHPPLPNTPPLRMPQASTQMPQYLNVNEKDMQCSADGPGFYNQPVVVGSDPSLSGRVQSGGNPRNSGLFDKEALLSPDTDTNQISAAYNSPVARPHRTSQLSDAGSYGVTGLSNFGNTCFMNSVLQCIIGTAPLKRYFMRGEWKKKLLMHNEERAEVVIEFAQLLELMWRGQHSYISPSRFRLAIGYSSEQFEGDNQEDAHEFASFLLDVLHESLNHVYPIPPPEREMTPDEEMQFEKMTDRKQASMQWKRYIRRSLSIITSIFQGQIQSRLTCMSCEHTSTTYHTFTELSVPIPEPCNSNSASGGNAGKVGRSFLRKAKQKADPILPVNIYQCLDAYSEVEVLDGDDKWICPRCKARRKATKQLRISRLPQVLILHLKRFSTRGHFREKLETNVHVPTQRLYMENYVTPGAHPSTMYNLYAMVNHFGTMSGGHYTASVFDELREQWNYFDDTKVFPISEAQVTSPAAYLLFFVQERAMPK